MSERPNVVWVPLDSVRQDRTTVGGHDRDTTPRLQALADALSLAEDLEEALAEWLATDGQPVSEAREAVFDDAMRKQLSGLGYVE